MKNRVLLAFNRWWDRHGGNCVHVEAERIFRAGWEAGRREARRAGKPLDSHYGTIPGTDMNGQ